MCWETYLKVIVELVPYILYNDYKPIMNEFYPYTFLSYYFNCFLYHIFKLFVFIIHFSL
jgi:hypothetical protein